MSRRIISLVLFSLLLSSLVPSAWAESNIIRITFDGNGAYLDEAGRTLSREMAYPAGEIDPATFPPAFLDDKEFRGWFFDPAGEEPYDKPDPGVTQLTLYAAFDELPYQELTPLPEMQAAAPDYRFHYTGLIGRDRFATAVAVSQTQYTTASRVVLANGYRFSDALAAAPLARALEAPVLLSHHAELGPETIAEITRLGANQVWLIGGRNVISEQVRFDLQDRGLEIIRLGGSDRFATAELINLALAERVDLSDTAFLTIYDNYPDALSIGGYAATHHMPILYSYPDRLPEASASFIEQSGLRRVVILGNQMGPAVVADLEALGLEVSRIGGVNRYQTNQAFLNAYYPSNAGIVLVKGDDYPDGLVASGLAGQRSAGVMLVESAALSDQQKDYIRQYGGQNNYQVGGIKGFDPKAQLERATIRILLDPGHSLNENASPVLDGYFEGNVMYHLALALKSYLMQTYDEVVVATTRDHIADNPTLAERGGQAQGYDLFLSLHTNAAVGRPDIRGSLIFDMAKQPYLATNPNPAQPNPELAGRLVAASARVHGHASEGVKYAYWNMVYGAGRDGFWSDSPAGKPGYWNNYGVLRHNRAKHAMLIEMGYHTNYQDAWLMFHRSHLMVRGLAESLAEYYQLPLK